TDHDSNTLSIDSAIDGDFLLSDVSSSINTTITATASSIDGTTFTKQFTVRPSQFSNGTADVGTLQLDNFPVINSGSIVVLQDLWFQKGNGGIYENAVVNGVRTVLSGQVDKDTLIALNTPGNVVLWAKNDDSLQAQLPNFYTYQVADSHRWMHASAAKFLHD